MERGAFPVALQKMLTWSGFPGWTINGRKKPVEPYSVMGVGWEVKADSRFGFVIAPAPRNARAAMVESTKRMNAIGLTCLTVDSYPSFDLKYSPSTALTASGTVSCFLAFRSASNAFNISSDTESIIFFIAIVKSPMPLG